MNSNLIDIPSELYQSITANLNNNAFCIDEKYYSYKDLSIMSGQIMKLIRENNFNKVAIFTENNISTYAAIVAVFLCGKTFIPIHPDNPSERNAYVIEQSNADVILTSSDLNFNTKCFVKRIDNLNEIQSDFILKTYCCNDIAYVLFTSGSTGNPKGVPISYSNLGAFLKGFFATGIELNSSDRVLQMFHLTFDLSLCSYMTGLLHGCCIYTIPSVEVKYVAVFETLENYDISFAIMVPSIISYLRPYFEEINLPALRYNVFCGEALYKDLVEEWQKSVPNARIFNVYGPTEDIICTSYELPKESVKSDNGIVCVGKPMLNNIVEVFDEQGQILPQCSKGEFCLAGPHLTKGYINEKEKNDSLFFIYNYNGNATRFYKSGDIGYIDEIGDCFYLGRNDYQVKVSGGYRVELSEVEYVAMKVLPNTRLVALSKLKDAGVSVIHIIVENAEDKIEELKQSLKKLLPDYMQPDDYHNLPVFPLNSNGKIDRKKIFEIVFS